MHLLVTLYKLDFNTLLAYFIYLLSTFCTNIYVHSLWMTYKRGRNLSQFWHFILKPLNCYIVFFGIYLNFYN